MTQSQVISYTYPGAVWPKGTGPAVLSWTNAFPNLAFPQHLTGQTNTVQNFLYPGAVQPAVPPLTQAHFRFRTDTLATDGTPTWGAAEDTL
jgi:hypothetical protein